MKRFQFVSIWLLFFFLGACGTVIRVEELEIIFPTRADITATASPSTTATATVSSVRATTTANLNIRSGPGTGFSIVGIIPSGQTVQVIGRTPNSSWLQISSGWIIAQYTTITGNLVSVPVVTPDPTPTREVPKSRISYNVNAQGIPSRAEFEAHIIELCPTTLTIMEDFSYAVQLYQLLRPCGTIVIHRAYSSLEGDEWFYRSPQNFIEQWRREGHPEIVRYSTNEPSFNGRIGHFVVTEIELMRLARVNGFTVAVGNFSVGIYRPEDINAGLFDSYIRALAQYGHYLALHEYACCALPFGVGQWGASLLLDRANVQPASWPSIHALPTQLWNGRLPPYWYLRRGDWWLLRADQINAPRPRIIVTEFGWDGLPDIKPIIEPLRQRFGLDRYFDDMRGVNTYSSLWAYYWPQWSFARAACEQLLWAMGIYPVEYIGFNLFTWSNNPHWLQTDFSGRENPAHYELHDCLENAAA